MRKLAKRVHPIVLEEYEQALNPTTTRNGTWATRKQITWSNTQVMAVRGTPWDAPPTASEEEVADPKAGMDEAARDAAAAAEEMSAGDGDAPTRSTPPAEEMVTTVEEPPLDPTQYQQLLLQQVTPLKTGVLRFPRTMKALGGTRPLLPRLAMSSSRDCRLVVPRNLAVTYRTSCSPLISRYQDKVNSRAAARPWPTKKLSRLSSTARASTPSRTPVSEDLLLLHVDFWHPAVTEDEKQMLAYFWMLWQFDQYHPSTRAKYTRRVNFRKDQERREREEPIVRLKKDEAAARPDKKDGGGGGGGGSIEPRKLRPALDWARPFCLLRTGSSTKQWSPGPPSSSTREASTALQCGSSPPPRGRWRLPPDAGGFRMGYDSQRPCESHTLSAGAHWTARIRTKVLTTWPASIFTRTRSP